MENILSEPEVGYRKPTLKAFASFEEADEENAKFMAKLSPREHLSNVTEQIKRIYRGELNKPMDKKLKFRD